MKQMFPELYNELEDVENDEIKAMEKELRDLEKEILKAREYIKSKNQDRSIAENLFKKND